MGFSQWLYKTWGRKGGSREGSGDVGLAPETPGGFTDISCPLRPCAVRLPRNEHTQAPTLAPKYCPPASHQDVPERRPLPGSEQGQRKMSPEQSLVSESEALLKDRGLHTRMQRPAGRGCTAASRHPQHGHGWLIARATGGWFPHQRMSTSRSKKTVDSLILHIVTVTFDSGEDGQRTPKQLVERSSRNGAITRPQASPRDRVPSTQRKGYFSDRDRVSPT